MVTENACAIFLAPSCAIRTLLQLIARAEESVIGWAFVVRAREVSCNTISIRLLIVNGVDVSKIVLRYCE
jgi:hypothetical protein